jgi:hypothetical protein
MTYKQIESSREARLWIGQILVPAVTTAATIVLANPELRRAAASKCKDAADAIRNKFAKKSAEDSNVKYFGKRG